MILDDLCMTFVQQGNLRHHLGIHCLHSDENPLHSHHLDMLFTSSCVDSNQFVAISIKR